MKTISIILSLIICGISMGYSQHFNRSSDQKGSRIEALKIAYVTKKLNLSPDEAQRFWPVYNDYSAEIREARTAQRQNALTELEAEDKILSIRKKYNAEFSRATSPDKANAFFRSEKEFGNYIQKELKERREQRQEDR